MMMRKTEGGEVLKGNDRFEGYCKDMMDLIAERLGITCEINQLTILILTVSLSRDSHFKLEINIEIAI